MSREPALLTSAGRMPERSQHRVSEGQDARSERPVTGHGQSRTVYTRNMASCRFRLAGLRPLVLTRPSGLAMERTSGDGAWAAPNRRASVPTGPPWAA